MAENVYTQRFITTGNAQGNFTWQCPAGYRGILTCISVFFQQAGSTVSVYVGGKAVWAVVAPGASSPAIGLLRCAIYGSESLQLTLTGAGTQAQATGYVFKASSGPVGTEEADAGGPLPPHWAFDEDLVQGAGAIA